MNRRDIISRYVLYSNNDSKLSAPLEDKEMVIVASFLKNHPDSTPDEIAKMTGIERIEVFYCLNILLERGIVTSIPNRPERWVLL